MSEHEYANEDHEADLPPRRSARPNPMHSRCGLEDCDCGYTIEKLLKALEWALPRINLSYAARIVDRSNYQDALQARTEARGHVDD